MYYHSSLDRPPSIPSSCCIAVYLYLFSCWTENYLKEEMVSFSFLCPWSLALCLVQGRSSINTEWLDDGTHVCYSPLCPTLIPVKCWIRKVHYSKTEWYCLWYRLYRTIAFLTGGGLRPFCPTPYFKDEKPEGPVDEVTCPFPLDDRSWIRERPKSSDTKSSTLFSTRTDSLPYLDVVSAAKEAGSLLLLQREAVSCLTLFMYMMLFSL